MTREEAEAILTSAGDGGDEGFPLLEAAIACAIHDHPFRDPQPVRTLARSACERLKERVGGESPDEALSETMAADLRLILAAQSRMLAHLLTLHLQHSP